MQVYIPYTSRIVPGVVEAVLAQGFVPNCVEVSHPDAYCLLLASVWPQEPFIVIEHDNLLADDSGAPLSLQALIDCPQPWCGYEYAIGINTQCEKVHDTAFGMTCFKDIRLAMPDIWESPSIDRRYHDEHRSSRYWNGLDLYLRAYAEQLGIKQHCHGRGQHLKDFDPPSKDKLRILATNLIIRST